MCSRVQVSASGSLKNHFLTTMQGHNMSELPNMTTSPTESSPCNGDCRKIRQRLWDYQQETEFCDVILETEDGERIWAHRVIISAGSQIIYNMLVDTSLCLKDDESGIRIVRMPGITLESLQDIVRFSYLGNVERINMETVTSWERFQMYEPVRLSAEAKTSKALESQSLSVPCSDIKSEAESLPVAEDDPMDDQDDTEIDQDDQEDDLVDGPDDPEYTPREKKKRSIVKDSQAESTTPVDSAKSESPRKKRKRKCSSPKQRNTRFSLSYKEDSSSEEDNLTVNQYLNTRTSARLKREETWEPEIECENPEVDAVESSASETEKLIKPKLKLKLKSKAVSTPKRTQKRTPKIAIRKTRLPATPASVKPGDPRLCKTCNMTFTTVKEYREHRENNHKGDRHKCIECGLIFNRANRLKAHRIDNHYKEGLPEPTWHHCKVEGCKFKSIYGEKVTVHNKTVHLKEKVICEQCGARFTQSCGLMYHKKRKHDTQPLPFKCETCDCAFDSTKQLQKHIDRVHNKRLNHLCDQCPYMAFDKISIDMHKFSRHGIPLPGENRTWHTCPHCDYKSVAKNVMQAHIERHEQKTFKCELCDSVFNCNLDLKTHRRNRHSTRPKVLHNCPYEGCKFVSKYGPATLKKHVARIHENKDYKPWACEICDYRTNVKGNLHLHLRKVHGLQPQTNERRVPSVKVPGSESSSEMLNDSKPLQVGHPQEHPQGHPQGHPQEHTRGHPQEFPRGHPQDHPQDNPREHIPGHFQGHPSDHPRGHLQEHHSQGLAHDHPRAHPQDDLRGHPQDNPRTHPQDNLPPGNHPHDNPQGNHPHPPVTVHHSYPVCAPEAYQSIPRTEVQRTEAVVSHSQVPPVYQTLSRAETLQRLPLGVPVLPGAQYGMVVPPVAYDEHIFMQGLQ